MKMVIVGSTGRTGQLLVEQALAVGHDVTAFARIPANVLVHHERLRVLQGDILDPARVEAAVAGNQVVLSALGAGITGSQHVLSNGVQNILRAMQKCGARRLVIESSYGVGDSYEDASLPMKLIFRTILKRVYADKELEDSYIRLSKVEWVVCRPTSLTSGVRTGVYRVGEHLRLGLGNKISRADVADFMLKQLTSDEWLYKFPALSY